MLVRRTWFGILAGLAVTFPGLLGMRYLRAEWFIAVTTEDVAGHQRSFLWLELFGAGLYFVALASRSNPWMAGVPAAVWLALYGWFTSGEGLPTWLPRFLHDSVLLSYGVHVPVAIGVMLGQLPGTIGRDPAPAARMR